MWVRHVYFQSTTQRRPPFLSPALRLRLLVKTCRPGRGVTRLHELPWASESTFPTFPYKTWPTVYLRSTKLARLVERWPSLPGHPFFTDRITLVVRLTFLHIQLCFEKGCRIKCTRQPRKVLWVVLSSLFFKEIWKNGRRGSVHMSASAKGKQQK